MPLGFFGSLPCLSLATASLSSSSSRGVRGRRQPAHLRPLASCRLNVPRQLNARCLLRASSPPATAAPPMNMVYSLLAASFPRRVPSLLGPSRSRARRTGCRQLSAARDAKSARGAQQTSRSHSPSARARAVATSLSGFRNGAVESNLTKSHQPQTDGEVEPLDRNMTDQRLP